MICPFVINVHYVDTSEIRIECIEEKCALWCYEDGCAIKKIALELTKITEK